MEVVKVYLPFPHLKNGHSTQLNCTKPSVCSRNPAVFRGFAEDNFGDRRHLFVNCSSDRHSRSDGASNSVLPLLAFSLSHLYPGHKVSTFNSTGALSASGNREKNYRLKCDGEIGIVGLLASSSDTERKPTGPEGTAGNLRNQGFIVSEVQTSSDASSGTASPPILADLLRKLCPQDHSLPEEANSSSAARDLVLSQSLNLAVLLSAPRRRLLIATAESLSQKVDAIEDSAAEMRGDEWLQMCTQTICSLTAPICNAWIALEASECKKRSGKEGLIQYESGRDEVRVSEPQSIESGNSEVSERGEEGVAELHSELMYLMRFRRTRPGSKLKPQTMTLYAPPILDDLIISLSEAVVTLYLDRWVGGEEEMPVLIKPDLASTRKLEKCRNEVALRKWLYCRFGSVEAMYEDRIDLWTINLSRISSEQIPTAQTNVGKSKQQSKERQCDRGGERRRFLPEPSTLHLNFDWDSFVGRGGSSGGVGVNRQGTEERSHSVLQNESDSVGRSLELRRVEPQKHFSGFSGFSGLGGMWREWSGGLRGWMPSAPNSEQRRRGVRGEREVARVVIERMSMPARRMKELRALRGGRLAFSLFLEAFDVAGPILRALCQKLGDIISFLLTFLIGRSLGLIYRGIRQSLRLKT